MPEDVKIYKQVGGVLIDQKKKEVKTTLSNRLGMIHNQIENTNELIKKNEAEQKNMAEKIQKAKQYYYEAAQKLQGSQWWHIHVLIMILLINTHIKSHKDEIVAHLATFTGQIVKIRALAAFYLAKRYLLLHRAGIGVNCLLLLDHFLLLLYSKYLSQELRFNLY